MPTSKVIQAGVPPQGFVLSSALYCIYTNDTLHTTGVYLGLFADDTCTYATDRKEGMFPENCSPVSVLLRCGVNAET
jgi:hypothetical protein